MYNVFDGTLNPTHHSLTDMCVRVCMLGSD